MAGKRHHVDLYRSDAAYADLVSALVAEGLRKGEACIVIATKRHRDALAQRLRRQGLLGRNGIPAPPGSLAMFDAARTLSRFMVNGMPDRGRFTRVVGGIIRSARGRGRRPVRVFGEMVALLLVTRGIEATLCLEGFWNRLVARQSFSLVCSYPLRALGGKQHRQSLGAICAEHHAISV
jgi:hypothetical protein